MSSEFDGAVPAVIRRTKAISACGKLIAASTMQALESDTYGSI